MTCIKEHDLIGFLKIQEDKAQTMQVAQIVQELLNSKVYMETISIKFQ